MSALIILACSFLCIWNIKFVFSRFYTIFVILSIVIVYITYLVDESVIAFILEWKSGKFQLHKDGNHTRHSVLVIIVVALAPRSNTSVGYCLFVQRYSRTSIQIDDSASHFPFVIRP